ncbi:CoA transferase [Erythrobacter sp. SDW2]|uniref:CoA transferase n=1 Tax=Erythrobacter sp. SDW2 TaxID=2907154 RepID=UPI001F46B1BB|nr:CoA transferase [Erythrobacter sp. SDW2]UIP06717.1 CoA transferase [Erythrobacter sp. SDW2]
MGEPELARDPRYATHAARGQNQAELDERIERWTLTLTVDQLEALMIEYSVPAGRVYTGKEMLAEPHFAERDALISVEHPQHGSNRMQAPMPKLSDTPSGLRRRAPDFPGQHNTEV